MAVSLKIETRLKELESSRRQGEITTREFYRGLLELVGVLSKELEEEELSEELIRKQIPFLLTFIKTQIKELRKRGN